MYTTEAITSMLQGWKASNFLVNGLELPHRQTAHCLLDWRHVTGAA